VADVTREQSFGFSVDVSLEFLAQEPEQAQRWLDARRDQLAKQEYATGPRGGTYRLVTPPDEWRSNIDPFWHPQTAVYFTKRTGRYVRPGRVRLRSEAATFGTFTIPRDDQTLLPDGRVIKTRSRFIDVPVPPALHE
jgi:hypothetical protein